jgi:hypothetical protein
MSDNAPDTNIIDIAGTETGTKTITTNTGTTSDPGPDTDPVVNGMVADPRKDGIPLFLQTQNRDRGAGPLLIYEDARLALARATTVNEVKAVRDKAIGFVAYAKKATDRQLEADAQAVRMEAERRLGQMMQAQPKATGGQPYQSTGLSENPVRKPITLAEAGIDKNLAHRARGLAAMPEQEFEEAVEAKRAAIQTPAPKPKKARRSHEQVLLERFPHAVGVVCNCVEAAADLEIPPGLTCDAAHDLRAEIKEAIDNLKRLWVRLGEVKDDVSGEARVLQ